MILNDMCINKPTREDQLTVTLAAIKIMESLVELTEDHLSTYYGIQPWLFYSTLGLPDALDAVLILLVAVSCCVDTLIHYDFLEGVEALVVSHF